MARTNSVHYDVEVRFADIDVMGHVNNAVYLSYFEQARMTFFGQFFSRKWDWEKDGILVARHEIDYKIPIRLQDQVFVEVWCNEVGDKSFSMNYEITDAKDGTGKLYTKGKSIIVCFNYLEKQTVRVPDLWRKLFDKA